jgi:DUF2075 family protein
MREYAVAPIHTGGVAMRHVGPRVEEAHALINPTAPNAGGVSPSGWIMHAGPQGWHIIRSSRVSVFLMDSAQSYRDNETTTPDDIVEWANNQGVTKVERISLAESQFRCGGSVEYVRWVETVLELPTTSGRTDGWLRPGPDAKFTFEFAESPQSLEDSLRARLRAGASARIVAPFAREWRTRYADRGHALPDADKDFHIAYRQDGKQVYWSRIWNHVPGGTDYTVFIQGPESSRMHEDPLCEVGCPYVIRGFDYDYLGVLWLSDLVWRGTRWVAQFGNVKETAIKGTLARAKRASREDDPDLLLRLKRAYRILLTRALKGMTVWFEDEETRHHIHSLLRAT